MHTSERRLVRVATFYLDQILAFDPMLGGSPWQDAKPGRLESPHGQKGANLGLVAGNADRVDSREAVK
jgi:hypothetical protein